MILGIDIGSRSIEVVAMDQGKVVEKRQAPTTFHPVAQVRALLLGLDARLAVATGYGRKLVQDLDLGFPVERPLVPGLEWVADFDRFSRLSPRLYANYLRQYGAL